MLHLYCSTDYVLCRGKFVGATLLGTGTYYVEGGGKLVNHEAHEDLIYAQCCYLLYSKVSYSMKRITNESILSLFLHSYSMVFSNGCNFFHRCWQIPYF